MGTETLWTNFTVVRQNRSIDQSINQSSVMVINLLVPHKRIMHFIFKSWKFSKELFLSLGQNGRFNIGDKADPTGTLCQETHQCYGHNAFTGFL